MEARVDWKRKSRLERLISELDSRSSRGWQS